MEAITPADLVDWLESEEVAASHRYDVPSPQDLMYEAYAAAEKDRDPHYGNGETDLNATQYLDYLRYLRDIADCPKCGTRNVELTSWEFPDMAGETYGYTFECCGYEWSRNTFLVYAHDYTDESDGWPADAHGRHVDVR